ncbi:MAG: RNA polymerase sigma-54 factor [Verrucomicrobiales bacterium]|nr:RNA polymerase sigma-54 factor [Verrucomicrobiales bacterium]
MQLGQRLAQVQTMSPQMQQSLAMLQAPMLDLRAMINKELQENPVLEEVPLEEIAKREETGAEGAAPENGEAQSEAAVEPPADTQVDPAKENGNEPVDDFQQELERLAELSEEWRDHFNGAQTTPIQRPTVDDEERRQFMFDSLTVDITLADFLAEQSRMSDLDADEMTVAEVVIGNIDEYGYLEASVEELMQATNEDRDMVEEVLCVIRSFEPAGVGARDLRECLLLQLERKGMIDSEEYRVVDRYMDALGRRRFPEIARALGVEVDEVQDIAENIGHLEPRPGRAFLPDSEAMVVLPEVFVEWKDGDYVVSSNREEMPQVRISNDYKDMLAGARDAKDVREYIRSKIRDGKFLIKSIQQRHDTILKIAKEIVGRQREFMDEGVSELKPMTMSEVAEEVGVHETTVSRAVSGKYMKTPQGLFEMRYFFTSALKTATGQDVSNASVKQVIQDLVDNEDKSKPLSDEQIVKTLADKDLKIARRTVAKYRGELGILSSNMRKVY